MPRNVEPGQIVFLDIISGARQKVIGFTCFLCNEIISTHQELVQHLKFRHQYQSPILQKEVTQKSIQINLKLNIASGTHPASPCSRKFSEDSKSNHISCPPELVRRASPRKSKSCKANLSPDIDPLCGLMVSSRSKCYVCSVCNRACMSNHHLSVHMRTHTGSRPYKCRHCSRAFVSKGVLGRHLGFCKQK